MYPRKTKTEPSIVILAILTIVVLFAIGFAIRFAWLNLTPCSFHAVKDAPVRCLNERGDMSETKYTLSTYTGVGSGVLKHGTIVKIVDGQPVVVGHFDDESGAEYPGTVEIKEAK